MWRALIILSASLLVTGICRATDIFGNVSGVWNASNNPYNVTGNVTVPPESTLVIQPGCQVIFQGHYIFKVDSAAILQAVGNMPILLYSLRRIP
jgi:hypothetical protein